MLDDPFLQAIVANVAIYGFGAVTAYRLLREVGPSGLTQLNFAIGIVLGLVAVGGMLTPITVSPGVVFDARAVAIAAAGFFAGPIGALAALLPPGVYRASLGGGGMAPGLFAMALSAGLGVGIRTIALNRSAELRLRHVAILAALLPVCTFCALPLFPSWDVAWLFLEKTGLAIAIGIPIGSFFLGLLLLDEERRARTVATLGANQDLIDAIHSKSPGLIFQRELGSDGKPRFRYMSKSAETILGASPEDIYANPDLVLQAVHPDDREMLLTTIQQAEVDGLLPIIEYRVIGAYDRMRWLRVRSTPSMRGGKRVWTGIATDVTEHKAAEEDAFELAQVFNESNVPMLRVDTDFVIRRINDAAAELYGYDGDDLIDRPSSIFRAPERLSLMSEFLAGLKANPKCASVESIGLKVTGERIPVRLDYSPLFDTSGKLVGWSTVITDLTLQKEAEAELQRLATTDQLTELPNRRSFQRRAAAEVARARRYKRPLAVIMVDIDHFKSINDRYGHAAGDEALRIVAAVLEEKLRGSGDLVARFGGEEFAILLPEAAAENATALAERLRLAVAAINVATPDQVIKVSASFGAAAWHPSEDSIDMALGRADKALYEAKAKGRNQVVAADASAVGLSIVHGGEAPTVS